MKLKDKLQLLMNRHGLNGQKLARLSQVSDSGISRTPPGKCPARGLDTNAFRLARAVDVLALDYLADDSLDIDASQPADLLSAEERKILNLVQKIGGSEVLAILENVRFLGYEVAMSRLIGAKPIIEIDKESTEHRAPAPIPATPILGGATRANSATA